jgi:hypothetical protein
MATAKKSTAVSKQAAGELVTYDYGDHAGVGMNLDMDDLKVPFVQLVQNDSRVLDSDESKYVAGGKPGQILNTASQVYTDNLLIVPAMRKTSYVEWLPGRAGFVAEHEDGSAIVREAKANAANPRELRTPAGNELQFTKSIYAIVLNEETLEPEGFAVIPFAASKLASWRTYWTKIDTTKATKGVPIYGHMARLAVKPDKSKEGKKFFNFDLYPAMDDDGILATSIGDSNAATSRIAPDSTAFEAGAKLFDMVGSGAATADHGSNSADEADSTPY